MNSNLETSREQIEILVKNFDEHIDAYKSNFNETNVRTQFIDKFFHLLGWDVYNKNNFSEQFRDVIPEDKIKVNSVTKAPDYSFRIGGTRVFFVEAKKPAVDIKFDKAPAFQLRRYGWTAKLSVSVLTDFEELAVYDCRVKPSPNDKAHVARRLYYTYKEFVEKWDEIYALFSKEAVMKGSIEKFISSEKKIKGTAKVDDEFLKEISEWRILLAKNIALRNYNLSTRDLNFVVQRTIDRIIFLRMCEDRGAEDFGRLLIVTNGVRIYKRLFELFREADQKYNSGLFYFRPEKNKLDAPDEISDIIEIDDKIIGSIIKRLYPPNCPYEFSVMPADILGNVYEQFLGKVIRLTKGHQAKIEDKPEVKKAGGVYYTPKYIVDYIIKNTIGKALESNGNNSKTKRLKNLKVLDPACGSGSFLIQAYQFLLDYHLTYYTKNNPEKWLKGKNPTIYEAIIKDKDLKIENYYKLTTSEKKRILLDNIYGVDIDSQAVEVTKLSLLLKVLEDENQDTLESQLKLFHERALPDLSQNIKCGNSLIGLDFYENQQLDLLDEEEQLKINVFDWQSAFPAVFNRQNPGFDVVVGNPPYVKEYTDKTTFHHLKNTNLKKYYQGKMDLWYLFTCLSIDLLKENGFHSFIATNNWITNAGASILRNKVLEETKILSFVDFSDFKVFENASIQTMIFVLQKTKPARKYSLKYTKIINKKIKKADLINNLNSETKKFKTISTSDYKQFKSEILTAELKNKPINFINKTILSVLDKIKDNANYYLNEKEIAQGIVAPQDFVIDSHLKKIKNAEKGDGIFVLTKNEVDNLNLTDYEKKILKPYYTIEQLKKYYGSSKNKLWVIYSDINVRKNINSYPNIKNHLDKFKQVITSDFKPYGLHRARKQDFFKGNKIISLRKAKHPIFTYTDFSCYVSQTYFVIKPNDINLKYLTGFLNSKLINFWLYFKGKKQGDQLQIDKAPLIEMPIINLDLSNSIDKERHLQMTKHVDRMIELHKRIERVKTPYEKTNVQNQINATDKAIDKMIYQLYDLTEDEIKIVEEATK